MTCAVRSRRFFVAAVGGPQRDPASVQWIFAIFDDRVTSVSSYGRLARDGNVVQTRLRLSWLAAWIGNGRGLEIIEGACHHTPTAQPCWPVAARCHHGPNRARDSELERQQEVWCHPTAAWVGSSGQRRTRGAVSKAYQDQSRRWARGWVNQPVRAAGSITRSRQTHSIS